MADGSTSEYGWTQPEVGASTGTWGTKLNAALQAIDDEVELREDEAAAAQTTADAALPKAGGTMTGALRFWTANARMEQLGSVSGSTTLGFVNYNAWEATIGGDTTFGFSNVPAGTIVVGGILELTNGGAYTVTWPGAFKWAGGTEPFLTESGVDLIVFVSFDNGTTFLAAALLDLS